jgi:hypothetical protein
MNNKKDFWFFGGYWLLVWVLPAVVLLYTSFGEDAGAFLRYFNRYAMISLVLPLGYILYCKEPLPQQLKKLLLYFVIPLMVFAAIFVSQLRTNIGGF